RIDEGEDEEQHGVDRVPGRDDGERRPDEDRRKYPEENRLVLHRQPLDIAFTPALSRERGGTVTDMARRSQCCAPAPAPSARRSRAADPCRRTAPRVS